MHGENMKLIGNKLSSFSTNRQLVAIAVMCSV